MLRKICVVFVASMVFAALGVSQELPLRERNERRAKEIQERQEAIFGGKLPPGTVTVVGRAALHSNRKGVANSLALLETTDNPDFRREMGLSDDQTAQMQSIRNDMRFQMMMLAPKYISRFKTMTDADHAGVQEELQKEIDTINQTINERVDAIVTSDQKTKAQTLVFQSIGGIDSPLIGMDTISTLGLTDEQKKKAEAAFKGIEAERFAQAEEGLKLLERAVEKGGVNMSAEDRKAIEEEGRALQARIIETGKKIGDNLRTFLTPEQLALEKRLMAARPSYLPPLPRAMWNNVVEQYAPGIHSWMPGHGAPSPNDEPKPFPVKEEADQ